MKPVHRFAALLAVGVLLPYLGYEVFWMKVLCFALFACAFNLLLGFTGLLSFGHAAFFGGAAYFCGFAVKQLGLTPELAVLFGAALAGGMGLVIGLVAIRRQGIYFAMITLAMAQMFYFFCVQAPFILLDEGRSRGAGAAVQRAMQRRRHQRVFEELRATDLRAKLDETTVTYIDGQALEWKAEKEGYEKELEARRAWALQAGIETHDWTQPPPAVMSRPAEADRRVQASVKEQARTLRTNADVPRSIFCWTCLAVSGPRTFSARASSGSSPLGRFSLNCVSQSTGVARRLIEEAKARQVVVFTHDTVLLAELIAGRCGRLRRPRVVAGPSAAAEGTWGFRAWSTT